MRLDLSCHRGCLLVSAAAPTSWMIYIRASIPNKLWKNGHAQTINLLKE